MAGDDSQEANAAGASVVTVQSLVCVWTTRAEMAGAELRDAADTQPMTRVSQLVQQAHALGQSSAIAYARSSAADRVHRCLSEVALTVKNSMAQAELPCPSSADSSVVGGLVRLGGCRPAFWEPCRIALSSVHSELRLRARSQPQTRRGHIQADTGRDEHATCSCLACSVTATTLAHCVNLEDLGLKTAAAVTRRWLYWWMSYLLSRNAHLVRFSCVSWNYFGAIQPTPTDDTQVPDSLLESNDICVQALVTAETVCCDSKAVTTRPVVSGEEGRLLHALQEFQATTMTQPRMSSLTSEQTQPVIDRSSHPNCNGQVPDAHVLTSDVLQAFIGLTSGVTANCCHHLPLSTMQMMYHAAMQVVVRYQAVKRYTHLSRGLPVCLV